MEIRDAMKNDLGEDYEGLRDYFQKIVNESCDMRVFISRRCYILFRMYAMTEGWVLDHVCTDLGIFAYREELKKSRRVIVADDIGYTGKSMQNVLKKIRTYVPAQCRIEAVLFAVNRKWADQIFSRKIGFWNRIDVKCCQQLTNHQCQVLSVNMVSAILDSGIPYTTFVYPVSGRRKAEIGECYKITVPDKGRELFEGHKWKTEYLDLEENGLKYEWIGKLSEYSCVRIYRNPYNEEYGFFLPFVFLKDIRKERVEAWYKCIGDVLAEMGCMEAAEEFREALKVKEGWRGDAWEYLASVMSCFCSRALAEILCLDEFLDISDEEKTFLEGSFTPVILQLLEGCSIDFAVLFFQKLCRCIEGQESFFCEDRHREKLTADRLSEYVSKHCAGKNAYEATCSIYEWLKCEDSSESLRNQPSKAICVEDIVSILEKFSYARKDIYLAQIECWDSGIATYRLRFDRERGIVAKCSAGEMSTVIPMLKYQDLVREYYNEVFKLELKGQRRTHTETLEQILRKALQDRSYTEAELDEFRNLAEKRNGSLYGLLIYQGR